MSRIQTKPSEYGKAIYYPNIEIGNPNWLKMTLLYWDGVRRIVPVSVTPSDSNEEVRCLVDEGLLENTESRPYIKGAEDRFIDYLLPLLDTPELEMAKLNSILPDKQFRSVYYVHVGKLSPRLRDELLRYDLARSDNEWLQTNEQIGRLYMMCLATEMGEKMGSSIVTDNSTSAKYGEYLTFGQPRHTKSESPVNRDLLKLGIEFPTPDSLSQVPISKIVEFSRKRFAERLAFREAIEGIIKVANSIDDPNAIEDYLQRERKKIESSLNDHREALKEINVSSLGSLLKISCPTIIASAAAFFRNPSVAKILTGLGFSMSIGAWWAERRGKERQLRQSNKWHYLLSVEKLH